MHHQQDKEEIAERPGNEQHQQMVGGHHDHHGGDQPPQKVAKTPAGGVALQVALGKHRDAEGEKAHQADHHQRQSIEMKDVGQKQHLHAVEASSY